MTINYSKPHNIWHRIGAIITIVTMLLGGQLAFSPTIARAATNTLMLSVVDASNSTPITTYKYLINIDNTGNPLQPRNAGCSPTDPGYPDSCDWPSIRAVPGAAPIFTQGNQDDFNGAVLSGLNLPDGKYLVSVMANGYKLGGIHFTMPLQGSGVVTVGLEPHPLPAATMRIRVFEDNASVNGQLDTDEHGLAGFHAVINDILGQISTDVFGSPLCTTYDAGGNPTGINLDGCLISDVNGDMAIPNLGPSRYDVLVIPPAGTTWLETTTLEGSPSWDTWLQEGGTGLDNEFVIAAEPIPWTIFGFVKPMDNLNSSATGGISGTLVAASVFQPPAGALPSYFGDQWTGFSGIKVNGPITNGWVALSDLQNGDQAVYVAPANPDGTYTITNVPDGNYLFTWWDQNLHYILDLVQVTVANGEMFNMGTPILTGWFTRVDGHVFNDLNSNGKRDAGEPGISDYLVVLKDRDNSEIDRMSISAITDADGYYVFEKAYPMGSWMILEAYSDRYYTTGVTYQVENQPEETTVLGAGVDVGLLPILGQGGRLDWGVRAYDPGTNGGIVGTVFYDTTRNELDPQYQAVEGWAPGIPGLLVALSRPVYCGTNAGVACDPTGTYELAADGSIAKDMTAGGIACGTTPGEACDPTGTWELDALGNYAVGPIVSTAITETWEQPTGCFARDAQGNISYQVVLPTDPNARCLEAPLMGTQFQSGFASLDGNYGFGSVFTGFGLTAPEPLVDLNGNLTWDAAVSEPFMDWNGNGMLDIAIAEPFIDNDLSGGYTPGDPFTDWNGNLTWDASVDEPFTDINGNSTWDASIAEPFTDTNGNGVWDAALPVEPVESIISAGDYLVEVVTPLDALGRPMYQVVREEDINIFGGDEFVPAVPPPACAGPLHTVDVAGVGADGPFAVDNPTFAEAGGSVFEGMQKPLCNVKLVTLNNGKSIAPAFTYFTEVPIPGRWKGYIINDLAISTDPYSLFYGEVAGLPNSPIGIYDFTNRMVASVTSDPNGVYEILLPSTYSINCPTPSGVCPNVYYLQGNDPNLAGYDPQFRTIGASFEIYPGLLLPSDLAPTQAVSSVLAADSQFNYAPQCYLDPATPQIFRVSQPYGGVGSSFTITGLGFGPAATGIVTLDGIILPVTAWSDTSITASIPSYMPTGPKQLAIQAGNGKKTVNGLTFHVTGSSYNPIFFEVGPGRTYATIQAAVDAAAAATGNRPRMVVVYPSGDGIYLENVVLYSKVILQGVGPGGMYADATKVPGSVIDGRGVTGDTAYAENWRVFMASLPWSGNQAIFEGPVVYVVAQDGDFTSTDPARIDGFTIQGGDQQAFANQIVATADPSVRAISGVQGGGIYVNGFARYLQITNNIIQSNGGAYGGAIRLGTPHLPGAFNDSQNDFIHVANNRVLANGGTNLAGAVAIFSGTEGYDVSGNDICGNFSAEYGGGISHYGLSPNGSIHHNRIFFNRSYDEGGGIMIAGELPADPNTLTSGAGPVDVFANLIQNNLANDDGGGLRFLMAGYFPYNVYNNIIVNNISTHEGGGVSLNDAPNVRFYNNTVMKNITTATALTSNGQPAAAGLSTGRNSNLLQATLPFGSPIFSDPVLFNNIFWDNRAGWFVGSTVAGIGLTGDPNPINHWDLGVSDGTGMLAPTNSILETAYGTIPDGSNQSVDPQVVAVYDTTVGTLPWRGHPRFVDVLMITANAAPNLLGDYHLSGASPAIDAGAASKSGINAPADDFDSNARPYQTAFDTGADEIAGPNANLFITKDDGRSTLIPGMSFTYTITVGNAGPSAVIGAPVTDIFSTSLINVSWTCVASPGASCGAISGSGNINTTVDLGVGSTATFTASIKLSTNPSGTGSTLENTATVVPPTGMADPILSNNAATDTDTIDRSFPKTAVLDTFTRANTPVGGGLGASWTGNTASFHIVSNVAEVTAAGTALWAPTSFGANQEAYFTLTRRGNNGNEQALLLKFTDTTVGTPSISNLASAWIMVTYNRSTSQVQIRSKDTGSATVTTLTTLPGISFNNGDSLGARVLDNGTVIVFKRTGTGTWTQIGNALTTFTGGGQIGVYFGAQPGSASNRARFDNFGGGTLP